jgi:hypothetical protein
MEGSCGGAAVINGCEVQRKPKLLISGAAALAFKKRKEHYHGPETDCKADDSIQ